MAQGHACWQVSIFLVFGVFYLSKSSFSPLSTSFGYYQCKQVESENPRHADNDDHVVDVPSWGIYQTLFLTSR